MGEVVGADAVLEAVTLEVDVVVAALLGVAVGEPVVEPVVVAVDVSVPDALMDAVADAVALLEAVSVPVVDSVDDSVAAAVSDAVDDAVELLVTVAVEVPVPVLLGVDVCVPDWVTVDDAMAHTCTLSTSSADWNRLSPQLRTRNCSTCVPALGSTLSPCTQPVRPKLGRSFTLTSYSTVVTLPPPDTSWMSATCAVSSNGA